MSIEKEHEFNINRGLVIPEGTSSEEKEDTDPDGEQHRNIKRRQDRARVTRTFRNQKDLPRRS